MLTPAVININSFFHPIGDTPAVCLTQSMPHSVAADVLLLGCGDVRNILFTCHVNGRQMDITCCDNQKAIIARNILLLSLIIDNEAGENYDLLWDIYYHMYITEEALDLLSSQAKKLCDLSATSASWEQSNYGSRLSYCDSTTLLSVRNIWRFYSTGKTGTDVKRLFESALERARSRRGDLDYLTGFRSTVPAQDNAKYGSTDLNPKTRAEAKYPNPTFLVGGDEATIHHCINPLFGFHLATAYVPIHPDDAEFGKLGKSHPLARLVEVARTEFRQWMFSYRKNIAHTKIRFIVGDAIAFAYTLQHKYTTTRSTAYWYQDRYGFQPLTLDGLDYASNTAPLDFDVIDTSNLSDHLGSLVLLTAAAPLVRERASSILFTEFLLKSSKTYRDGLDRMLGGHVPTLSTLLGLYPVEYLTNLSSIALGDEETLNMTIARNSKDKSNDSQKGQMYFRTCWKSLLYMSPRLPTRVQFEPNELAKVLYQVYAYYMFPDEVSKHAFKDSSVETLWDSSQSSCHHASFTSFLRLVRSRFAYKWSAVMRDLLMLIERRLDAPIVKNHIQELYAYLHIMKVFSADIIKNWANRSKNLALPQSRITPFSERFGDLRDSEDTPPVVCMTLKIPREKLAVLTKMNRVTLDTTVAHCIIQNVETGSQEDVFSACQLAFGDISTSGEGYDQSFQVSVAEDHAGWNGVSPLIAVFYLPAFVLLRPRDATVSFAIHSTSEGLKIHETTLDDVAAVYITRYAPNQTAFPIINGYNRKRPPNIIRTGAVSSIVPGVDPETGKILTFTGRLDVICSDRKQAIENGCDVELPGDPTCDVKIRLGQTLPLPLYFPVYIVPNPIPIIDRESSYIEVTVQVADGSKWRDWPKHIYQMHIRHGGPICWNMPYIQLAKCPMIDIDQHNKLHWLRTHMYTMMSTRRQDVRRGKGVVPKPSIEELAYFDFIDCVNAIFLLSSGILGRRSLAFCLLDSSNDIPYVFILVRSLRINLADRAVVLDCAVTAASADLAGPSHAALLGMSFAFLRVTTEQVHLWQQALPSYMESCRTWAHVADCDYTKYGQVRQRPEHGMRFLCTCGQGQFPEGYYSDEPSWEMLKKYFVRAAISPAFFTPFAGDTYRPGSTLDHHATQHHIAEIARIITPGGCQFCSRAKQKDGKDLLLCPLCLATKYCSPTCQKLDWKMHKENCKKVDKGQD
ncbi:hypothetical protein F4823DRAFT_634269 [Ustulina deusta]|nr:hypothetical protein F4823DRAFT_634269 [Ustulina deusta]